MLPAITRAWTDLVAGYAALAIQRQRGDEVDDRLQHAQDQRLRELSAETRTTSQTLLSQLSRRFELDLREELALWTLAASQWSPSLHSQLLEMSSSNELERGCIANVAYRGIDGDALSALSMRGTLVRYGLVNVEEGGTWFQAKMRATERTLQLCMASSDEAHDLPLDRGRRIRPIAELATHPTTVAELEQRIRHNNGRQFIVLSGLPGMGRRTTLASVLAAAGVEWLEVDATRFSSDAVVFQRELRACARECKLRSKALLVTHLDALQTEKLDRLAILGHELLPLMDTPVFATCGIARPARTWDPPPLVIEMAAPTSSQRVSLWHRALGSGTREDAQLLGGMFPLAPALIVGAGNAANTRASGAPLKPDDVFFGISTVLDERLRQFAKRVKVTQSWDDLVLPQDMAVAIEDLVARARERQRVYEEWGFADKLGKGLGISALFSGPPGTGKTMVAGLIAKELSYELYQVDMAKLVSKWIGETEKNLAALFDAAEAACAVLLFDEADALFGKRTEVKSSNDRFANFETNYLLQRLESYTGICLLTTNHESNLDPAFQRRLSLHLRFSLPELHERRALWQTMLPSAAPADPDIDFESLARRFVMSAGYIRNATLRAAFRAAAEKTAISNSLLEQAARLEYESMGKLST